MVAFGLILPFEEELLSKFCDFWNLKINIEHLTVLGKNNSP